MAWINVMGKDLQTQHFGFVVTKKGDGKCEIHDASGRVYHDTDMTREEIRALIAAAEEAEVRRNARLAAIEQWDAQDWIRREECARDLASDPDRLREQIDHLGDNLRTVAEDLEEARANLAAAREERDAARELLEAAHREIEVVRWQSGEMRKLLVECYHALDGARSDDEVDAIRDKLSLIKWDAEERDASQKGAE